MSNDSTGALKVFIGRVGLLLMVLGAGLVLVFFVGIIESLLTRGWNGGVFMELLLLALCGAISSTGWRMYRYWNPATIAEYSAIQALFTALAIGGILNLFLDHWGKVIGLVVFLVLLRVLKSFLLRYLGFTTEDRDSAEEKPVDEVAGTPWQNNPGYTGR